MNLKKVFFFSQIFIFTYLFYIYPFDSLSFLIYDESIFKKSSLVLNLFFSSLIIYYFQTNNTFFLLRLFVYEGVGIGFISFWIINIGLLINLFFSEPFYIGICSLLSILVFTIISLINGRIIKLKQFEILSKKLNKRINIIFISDVHLGSNSINHLQKICTMIEGLDYDFLVIGGDLLDSSKFKLKNLEILKRLRKQIFFVSGNHEYYLKNYRDILKTIRRFNINFLNNESFKYNKINIVGISDYQTIENKLGAVNKLVDDKYLNLVVVHKPDLWDLTCKKVDLILSGHTHKGQIFPFNLFVKFKFKYVYGLFQRLDSKLYVSSGCGCWGPKMRLGSQNEIVRISICGNKLRK